MLPDPPPSRPTHRPSGGLHSRLEPKPTPAKRPTRPTIFLLLLTLVILLLLLVIPLLLHLCTSPLHSIGTSHTPTTKHTISFNPLSMLLLEQKLTCLIRVEVSLVSLSPVYTPHLFAMHGQGFLAQSCSGKVSALLVQFPRGRSNEVLVTAPWLSGVPLIGQTTRPGPIRELRVLPLILAVYRLLLGEWTKGKL